MHGKLEVLPLMMIWIIWCSSFSSHCNVVAKLGMFFMLWLTYQLANAPCMCASFQALLKHIVWFWIKEKTKIQMCVNQYCHKLAPVLYLSSAPVDTLVVAEYWTMNIYISVTIYVRAQRSSSCPWWWYVAIPSPIIMALWQSGVCLFCYGSPITSWTSAICLYIILFEITV